MTRRRWIADEYSAERAALTGAHAAHLARTLRARVGQQFEVACGDEVRQATISSVSDERVEFTLGDAVQTAEAVPLTLLLAVFKFDRMEWAIEKCTELNVTTIIPLITRRTEKHLALAADKRVERWRRIAREAAEQSRRAAVPEIRGAIKLQDALRSDSALRIVLAESEREIELVEVLCAAEPLRSVALAIGPEGGWTGEEVRMLTGEGWIAAGLGETILRAETAAIAAVAITRAWL